MQHIVAQNHFRHEAKTMTRLWHWLDGLYLLYRRNTITPTTEITVVAPISTAVHCKETKNKHCFIHCCVVIYVPTTLLSDGQYWIAKDMKAKEDNRSENLGVRSILSLQSTCKHIFFFGGTFWQSIVMCPLWSENDQWLPCWPRSFPPHTAPSWPWCHCWVELVSETLTRDKFIQTTKGFANI